MEASAENGGPTPSGCHVRPPSADFQTPPAAPANITAELPGTIAWLAAEPPPRGSQEEPRSGLRNSPEGVSAQIVAGAAGSTTIARTTENGAGRDEAAVQFSPRSRLRKNWPEPNPTKAAPSAATAKAKGSARVSTGRERRFQLPPKSSLRKNPRLSSAYTVSGRDGSIQTWRTTFRPRGVHVVPPSRLAKMPPRGKTPEFVPTRILPARAGSAATT